MTTITMAADVGDIALRVRDLVRLDMTSLRSLFGTCETKYTRYQECLGMDKGQLIEAIIMDEFCEDDIQETV